MIRAMHAATPDPSPDYNALDKANLTPLVRQAGTESFPIAVLPKQAESEAESGIARAYDLNPLIARVLAQRNFKPGEKLARYLSPSLDDELARAGVPAGLDRAIELVFNAIQARHRIAICCDYDVDGTSAAAIMGRLIEAQGGRVEFFTPDRLTEGYGLNRRIVDCAISKGCRTLVALDFGTSNHAELAVAKAHGLATVVIDHHHIQRGIKPPASDAFVNPQDKSCGFASGSMCSAGLVYVFAARYVERFGPIEQLDLSILQGLAALGTVADVVPLSGINRALVRTGIAALADRKVAGVTQLAERARLENISSASDIGFVLGPRINAAGRVGEKRQDGNGCAVSAVELLMSDSAARCYARARDLDSMNRIRRDLERDGLAKALEQLRGRDLRSAVVVASSEIHEGVAGIIAARLVDRFNLPAIVLCQNPEGLLRGSARNVRSMLPLVKTAKKLHLSQLLANIGVKSGGHAGAAGLSLRVENLADFREAFVRDCERALKQLDTTPNICADAVVTLRELRSLDQSFWEQLKLFEPCDQTSNPGVSFGIKAGCVVAIESIDGHHSKVIVRQSDLTGDSYIALHLWQRGPGLDLQPGQVLNLVCRPIKRSRLINSRSTSGQDSKGFELVAYSTSRHDLAADVAP